MIFNEHYLIQRQIVFTIKTDASTRGWGSVYQGVPTEVKQNLQEQKLDINVLEMKAVKLVLLAYQMKAIHFQIDKTTALSYLVKMGGTKSNYITELA